MSYVQFAFDCKQKVHIYRPNLLGSLSRLREGVNHTCMQAYFNRVRAVINALYGTMQVPKNASALGV